MMFMAVSLDSCRARVKVKADQANALNRGQGCGSHAHSGLFKPDAKEVENEVVWGSRVGRNQVCVYGWA